MSSVCQICKKTVFKYSCPKCSILYCSVSCYKSENHLKCSEEFYKSCVAEEMALQSATNSIANIPGMSDDIKRMYSILKRMESRESVHSEISDFDISDDFDEDGYEEVEELDSDDETTNPTDLEKRLDGVNINHSDEVWSKLSNQEKQEFHALIQDGGILQLLPPFTPWWDIKEKKKLIEDVDDDVKNLKNPVVQFSNPKILEKIEIFEKLTSKQPAPCLINNLLNILGAYTCTVRFFNGDHHEFPHEAACHLCMLSLTLKKNINFDDKEQSLKSIISESQAECLETSTNAYDLIKNDVQNITEGRYTGKTENLYILSALSDIHRLFTAAKTKRPDKIDNLKTGKFSQKFLDHEICKFQEIGKIKLNCLIKKIEYFLSYVDCKC